MLKDEVRLPGVVVLVSHPTTGQIALAQADDSVRTYHPQPIDPTEVAFGAYRWRNGCTIRCAELFYDDDGSGDDGAARQPLFHPASRHVRPGQRLDLSLSEIGRLLVAHRNQLAVFVFDTSEYCHHGAANGAERCSSPAAAPAPAGAVRREAADLLWTTQLPGRVISAKIFGDGEAIALLMERHRSRRDASAWTAAGGRAHDDGAQADEVNDDDADAYGVLTFERDVDDGSGLS
jgi:hypothetical protein